MSGYHDASGGADPETWIIDAAVRNARQGLAKFVREEDLPPPTFPSTVEMNNLITLSSGGNDYSQLHEWITAHWNDAD